MLQRIHDRSYALGQVSAARRILAQMESECPEIPEDQYCVVMMWLSAWAQELESSITKQPHASTLSTPSVSSVAA